MPWSIDDASVRRQQIADGVDGVVTDYPTLLHSVLANFGMPRPPAYH